MIGTTIGHYEVTEKLGAGGMGEVYKARDTRLDRSVAIKVLPKHVAEREESRARFEREARTVASLNHPHICTLHAIGDGYMVMELIEGNTPAEQLEKGALPLEQTLTYATQIADALDRAHRAGLTHRDIKPQNIMITRDGVKVLDFGLAKSTSVKAGPTEATLTNVLTTEGTVLGTPQYMAPEQFEGREADERSDIWAFGAVLYEMITGQKAFQGKSYSSLVGAILSADPAPMSVKPFTPGWPERLVRRCLEKDPEDRWQSMRDVVLELRSPVAETPAVPAKPSRWPWVLAACLAAIALTLAMVHFREVAPELPSYAYTIPPPPNTVINSFAISPDGRRVAISVLAGGQTSLWARALDSFELRELSGTAGAILPFWSPDGRFISFAVGPAQKKVAADGGPITTIGRGGRRQLYGNLELRWSHPVTGDRRGDSSPERCRWSYRGDPGKLLGFG